MNKGTSRKQKILNYIKKSEVELFPKQISDKLGLNDSTVRKYCRDLYKDGLIIQPYRGTYASNIIYGMMIAPVRVHNVVLHIDAPLLKFSDDITEIIGGVKVRVQFGLQRKNITIYLSCKKGSKGMNRDTFLFALNRSYSIVEEYYGMVPHNVVLRTFELNRDLAGVRIDGVTCYTRRGFEGLIDRIYQKDGSVRSEVKVSSSMDIKQLERLLMGSIPTSQGMQGIFMLTSRIDNMFKVMQHTQEQIQSLFNLIMEDNKRRNKKEE